MLLITGAKGQLGSCLAELLTPEQAYFCDIEELDIADITSVEKFAAGENLSAIINCAAYTNVDKAEDEQEKAFAINVAGAANLAKLSAEKNIPIIHISTDYVYGGNFAKELLTEETAPAPQGVYAQSKFFGENEIKKYAGSYIIIRTAWLYSQYGRNFLKTILRVAQDKSEVKVVVDQIGTPTYAPDLAQTILTILSSLRTINSCHCEEERSSDEAIQRAEDAAIRKIYNFTNEGVCSWYDFANEIIRHKNLNCKVLPIKTGEYPAKAKRPFFSAMDKSKIKKDFNLQIDHWTKGVEKCLTKLS
jgi:dTDP-4-dehydrorhamnose reductase